MQERVMTSISNPTQATVTTPDVSFLIAAYNVAPFIAEALASGLDQCDATVELIVVDDGSDDGTTDIVAEMASRDPRIIHIRNDNSSGPAAARNQAIAVAKGTWLAVLDGDDVITPGRTARLLALAEATSADIVADNFERITVDGAPTGATMFPKSEDPFSFVVDVATFLDGNLALTRNRFSLGAIKPMIRSAFVRRHGLDFPQDLQIGEDYQFLVDALLKGARFIVSSHDDYKYRIRPGSQSWRLKPGHAEHLIAAHRASGIEARVKECERTGKASQRYERALIRSGDFVNIVERLKQGDIAGGLFQAASTPRAWPLLVRFGSDAVGKRIFRTSRP